MLKIIEIDVSTTTCNTRTYYYDANLNKFGGYPDLKDVVEGMYMPTHSLTVDEGLYAQQIDVIMDEHLFGRDDVKMIRK